VLDRQRGQVCIHHQGASRLCSRQKITQDCPVSVGRVKETEVRVLKPFPYNGNGLGDGHRSSQRPGIRDDPQESKHDHPSQPDRLRAGERSF
jgi:hypothetical protein